MNSAIGFHNSLRFDGLPQTNPNLLSIFQINPHLPHNSRLISSNLLHWWIHRPFPPPMILRASCHFKREIAGRQSFDIFTNPIQTNAGHSISPDAAEMATILAQ
jgi:hypothetical protein